MSWVNLYTMTNVSYFAKDVSLTSNYIERLKKANIQCIYIDDALSEGLEAENVIPDELKIKSIAQL